MIIYLHGFNASSSGDHEKILQFQSIDSNVYFISYSTLHPRHDMQHLLKEVYRILSNQSDNNIIISGVGLGGYWAERIGFLCGIKQVIFNPNLFPYENMVGRIARPEEYLDISTKCVANFRQKNNSCCLVILSRYDDVFDSQRTADTLSSYYQIIWDEQQCHKFNQIAQHLLNIKAFMSQ